MLRGIRRTSTVSSISSPPATIACTERSEVLALTAHAFNHLSCAGAPAFGLNAAGFDFSCAISLAPRCGSLPPH